jgi:hypothetical protein
MTKDDMGYKKRVTVGTWEREEVTAFSDSKESQSNESK